MRQSLQGSKRDEALGAVQEITGRPVIAYLGDVDTAANVAALVFVLEPQPESGTVEVAEAS